MFSKQNLESEVREFMTEYMVKKVGRDRLIRISTFGPVEREDLNLSIFVKDLTKEEEFKLSRELLYIFDKEDLDIPFGIFSQKYLKNYKASDSS
ncbi:MAG TPA: hypothetical protein EYP22_03600 [Methanosarcinales archaeon]|nr:hypothetical protein [Methanosarcinales archaeon]